MVLLQTTGFKERRLDLVLGNWRRRHCRCSFLYHPEDNRLQEHAARDAHSALRDGRRVLGYPEEAVEEVGRDNHPEEDKEGGGAGAAENVREKAEALPWAA